MTHAKKPAPQLAKPQPEPGVRILCVDDHAVLVEGLKAHFAISGRLGIVGSLPSASGLLEQVEKLAPDIVLLDVELPGPDVFEIADRLHQRFPALRTAFLTAHIRDAYLAAAYKCGAWGYFAKSDDLADIEAGLLQIARSTGGTFILGPRIKAHTAGGLHAGRRAGLHTQAPSVAIDALTAREIEVLRLIGKGLSRHDIARELSRSPKTIDGHQERIIRKLGVESRSELLRLAIREGFAEP